MIPTNPSQPLHNLHCIITSNSAVAEKTRDDPYLECSYAQKNNQKLARCHTAKVYTVFISFELKWGSKLTRAILTTPVKVGYITITIAQCSLARKEITRTV